jgi:iron complex outermembrane recepter protein
LTTGEALPRIAPLRLGAGLHYQKNSFGARVDVLHAFDQNRTAANELATNGYTDLSALVSYKLPTKLNIELFAKANNLLNQEIREHASILKDIAPQGERSVLFGVRSDF